MSKFLHQRTHSLQDMKESLMLNLSPQLSKRTVITPYNLYEQGPKRNPKSFGSDANGGHKRAPCSSQLFKATVRTSDFSVLLTRIINYLISDTTHVQRSAKRVESFCPQQGYTFKQHYPSLAVEGGEGGT